MNALGKWLQRKFPDKMSADEVNETMGRYDKRANELQASRDDHQRELDRLTKHCNDLSAAIVKADDQLHTLEVQQVDLVKRVEALERLKNDVLKLKSLELTRQPGRKFPDMSEAYIQ